MLLSQINGALARLLARVGTPASSTIAAKLDTLHDTRITGTRAANLDNLDAPISGITGGGTLRRTKLDSTAGATWTHPAGLLDAYVLVTLVAAGGAGARDSGAGDGGGGGGGGGIIYRKPYFLSGASTSISVPAATAGRATDGAGADGGNCVFGTETAYGGKGGNATNDGGAGGSGTNDIIGADGGDYNAGTPDNGSAGGVAAAWEFEFRGGGGGSGVDDGGLDGGPGGNSRFAKGGTGNNNCGGGGASWGAGGNAVSTGGAGANAPANGGGGGGGCSTGTSGAGAAGFILIEWVEG